MRDKNIKKEEFIFGLDIGTRTVMGIVGYRRETQFIVLASKIVEHESRAMVDGQIHDVIRVAKAVQRVKEDLEEQIDMSLNNVAIAAAGRVLKTMHVKVEQHFEETREIDSYIMKGLELQGVETAQSKLLESEDIDDKLQYFCAGYSVVNYYLNGYLISNLEGHKGKSVGAEVLATFLPQTVVDSLYAVVERVGLTVSSLTLEPIAAIQVAIPENLRLLNLALVDVGAGTSDIAITKEGSIIAYDMIPLAGDEITEQIVHAYLVDFQTAEKIKHELSKQNTIEFQDILGIGHKVEAQEIIDKIEPGMEKLANTVAEQIYHINGQKSPNAVFCVGGGSQMSGFTEKVATALGLAKERVAVRGSENFQQIVWEQQAINGPDTITPLGICMTALHNQGHDFIYIKVNERDVKLFSTKKSTVADAALAVGMNHIQMLGRKGRTLMFKINGERIRLQGTIGKSARILVNGENANLETELRNGDAVEIEPAQNGQDATAYIREYIKEYEKLSIVVDGEKVSGDYQIQSGDEVYTSVMARDKKDEEISLDEACKITVIINGKSVRIEGDSRTYMFVDVFSYIDFDLANPKGTIILRLNGKRAAFTDTIQDGDQIEIYWEKEK